MIFGKKISGDASSRNFYRTSSSIIVFSNKNKKKNLIIYDAINQILLMNKINVPKTLRTNYKKNYIEIQDLGKMSGLNQIKDTKNKFNIYKKIIKLLIKLQHINIKKIKTLKKNFYKVPIYSKKELVNEASLFIDWYIPYELNKLNNSGVKKRVKKIILKLVNKLKLQNNIFVHRDFHLSNIMFFKKKYYLIDNQDALIGNMAYDLASLIDDVRYKTPLKLKKDILNYYLKMKKMKTNEKNFKNDFNILSVLRNLKILGIFVRLAKRDRKKKYMKFIPYCWKLIEYRIQKDEIFRDLRSFFKKKEFEKFIKIK